MRKMGGGGVGWPRVSVGRLGAINGLQLRSYKSESPKHCTPNADDSSLAVYTLAYLLFSCTIANPQVTIGIVVECGFDLSRVLS